MIRLENAVAEAREVAQALTAEYPDLREDEELWLSSVESLTDALEVAAALQRRALAAKRDADRVDREIADLRERAARFHRQHERLKGAVLAIMQAAEVKTIRQHDFDVRRQSGAMRVVIKDEAAIPAEYQKVEVTIDKLLVRHDLMAKGSQAVPGAELQVGDEFLIVRTR